MLLAEAAHISESLRQLHRQYLVDRENRSSHFREILDLVSQVTQNARDDLEELIEILYPRYSKYQRQFTSIREIRDDACKKLSISPLVWDEALAGKPMVPLLSLESPEYGGEGMTIKDALNLMGFLDIASKMNEKEALLFWSRALDEQPMMPIDRFLQVVSYLTDGNAQSLTAIRRMLEIMHPSEVMAKLFGEQMLNNNSVTVMQPGQPFKAPIYRAWNKLTTPGEVYAEVINKPRRYLHITEFPKGKFNGVLYNRDRQVVGKVTELPYEQGEAIFEVESDINKLHSVTDILAIGNEWDIYKLPYPDRIAYLNRLKLSIPVKSGKFLEASVDYNHLLETLEPQERLRLTSPGPIVMGGDGGWMILKDAFHIHLLVSAIRKDEEFNTYIRLSAMDGYEMYEVGELEVPIGPAQHMRQRFAQQGLLAGQNWLPTDEYGLVVMLEIKEFNLSDLCIKQATLEYVDDNMGYGDVSQLTDLIEMGH